MKHLKDYFNDFEPCKLNSLFDRLYQDDWEVSGENLVDSFGTEWDFSDVDPFTSFSRHTFRIIVAGYKIFLGLLEDDSDKSSDNIQEKLESANSKIKLLEEQNGNLKKELDTRRKELHDLKTSVKSQKPSKTEVPKPSKTEVPVESPKASTKEYITLKRRRYVKIE